jgi:DNA helicase II / ATP-dependent DNA helicase PcrA
VFGQTQSNAVSRFVREIPTQYLEEIGGSRDGDHPFGFTFQAARGTEAGAAFENGSRAAGAHFPANSGSARQVGAASRQTGTAASKLPFGRSENEQRPPAANATIDFRKGDRVSHPKFGSGKILSVEPVAGDAILLIEFSSGEQKRMMARMARLEKI